MGYQAQVVCGNPILSSRFSVSIPHVETIINLEMGAVLSFASISGCKRVVKILLKRNIQVNFVPPWIFDGGSPLILAAEKGHFEVVKLLIEKERILVNQVDNNGYSALMVATRCGHLEVVKLLIEKEEIMMNQVNNKGYSALMPAA